MTNATLASKSTARNRAPTAPAKPRVAVVRAKTPASTPQVATAVPPKQKLVRDSFTIPKSEYAVLEGLKVRATNLKRPTKKSEMLRAGIAALQGMTDKAFLRALNSVPSLKTGRPMGSEALVPAARKGVK
jgi:hypothetical protein